MVRVRIHLLFSIDDIDPFSKKEFNHNFMMIESYKGDLRIKDKEAEELRWLSYNEIVKEGMVPIVQKAADRLHHMGLL
jgi:hypothetical protein